MSHSCQPSRNWRDSPDFFALVPKIILSRKCPKNLAIFLISKKNSPEAACTLKFSDKKARRLAVVGAAFFFVFFYNALSSDSLPIITISEPTWTLINWHMWVWLMGVVFVPQNNFRKFSTMMSFKCVATIRRFQQSCQLWRRSRCMGWPPQKTSPSLLTTLCGRRVLTPASMWRLGIPAERNTTPRWVGKKGAGGAYSNGRTREEGCQNFKERIVDL